MSAALPPLFIVAGPTASGKTALAVALATAMDGEVVSADSMQIYEGLSVGTACPTEEEKGGIEHHLIGCVPLTASYSVAQYAKDARRVIGEIHKRKKLPILCGGTGQYIQAVAENLLYDEQKGDRAVRDALRAEAEQHGTEKLLAELNLVDPDTAARLHPNDVGRIVRALELYRVTGMTVTKQNEASRKEPPPYRVRGIYLDFHDRDRLYERIEKRIDKMLSDGLVEEARRLFETKGTDTVRQAIGYKELRGYLDGTETPDEAKEALYLNTRHYAKRQLSWFRHKDYLTPVFADDYENTDALASAVLKKFQE